MRCSIIILSFALAVLAAPVPQADLESRTVKYVKNTREAEPEPIDQALAVDKRFFRAHDGKTDLSREVEAFDADLEARSLHYKGDRREAAAEADGIRYKGGRREAAAEANGIRYKGGRREAAAEANGVQYKGNRPVAPPGPGFRNSVNKARDAEPEAAYRDRVNDARNAEPEAAYRDRVNEARDAEPEPGRFRTILVPHVSRSEAGERSVVDISLRDIYNSARGFKIAIVEALKG